MAVDDVPEEERIPTAREVAGIIPANLKEGISFKPDKQPGTECCRTPRLTAAVVPEKGGKNNRYSQRRCPHAYPF